MSTIKRELTRRLLWTLLPLMAVGGIGVYLAARSALVTEFDATLRSKATALTVATQQDDGRVVVEIPDVLKRDLQGDSGFTVFEMWDGSGAPIRRSRSLNDIELPRFGAPSGSPLIQDLALPAGIHGRGIALSFVPAPVNERDEHAPSKVDPVRLVVASDRRTLDGTLARLAAAIAVVGGVMGMATLVIVPRALARGLSPLKRLADQAAAIDARSLATRFPTDALPAELTPITERLNALLARLEDSFERERRFGADLAHELRTPVAELRASAELALRWPEAREPHTDRDTLAIARHMEGLVERLLALVRSERGLLHPVPRRLSLGGLLTDVCRGFASRSERKRLDVRLELPADDAVESDPVLLRSIVTNLIENAVDYASPASRIGISATVSDGRLSIKVNNLASQLDAADVPRLFERFWQKDGARTDAGHNGLGLALASAYATTLGLTLTAALDGAGILTMSLAGPAAIATAGPAGTVPRPDFATSPPSGTLASQPLT